MKPFHEKSDYDASMLALGGSRPQLATSDGRRVPDELWKLFGGCWEQKLEERISIDEFLHRFPRLSQPMELQEQYIGMKGSGSLQGHA